MRVVCQNLEVVVLAAVGISLLWCGLLALLGRNLKLRHKAISLALGDSTSPMWALRMVLFVANRQHRGLDDPSISLVGDVAGVCFALANIAAIVLLLATIFCST